MKKLPTNFVLVGLAGLVACLVLRLVEFHELWPYQCGRWVVCSLAVFLAWNVLDWRRWFLVAVAAAFNPIAPIYFREAWMWVDLFSALVFSLVSADWIKKAFAAVWGCFWPWLKPEVSKTNGLETLKSRLELEAAISKMKKQPSPSKDELRRLELQWLDLAIF